MLECFFDSNFYSTELVLKDVDGEQLEQLPFNIVLIYKSNGCIST